MAQTGGPITQAIPYNVTVAPGSSSGAPVTTAINLGDVWCYSVDLLVPRGPSGAMGFNLSYAGVPIVPWAPIGSVGAASPFLIVDNWQETVEVDSELGSSLTFVAYNTGYWSHTVYMRFNAVPISAYQANRGAPVQEIQL